MSRITGSDVATGAVVMGMAALLLKGKRRENAASTRGTTARRERTDSALAAGAAREINRGAGLLAGCVLADSAVEHLRGSFHNRAMYTPLVTSTLSLLASAHGHADNRGARHRLRRGMSAGAALSGVAGTAYHLFNIRQKPGGFSWQNLFYAAPVGAPAALVLSGAMGMLAERVRDTASGAAPIGGVAAGRAVAAVTAAGLLSTVGEAGLMHFRGAYHNPAMVLPVTLPPLAAAFMGKAAYGKTRHRPFTRLLLQVTAGLGFAGSGFHARGVARRMGGWHNWTQNLLSGPPIPAPPAFTGLALTGLAALKLMEAHPDG